MSKDCFLKFENCKTCLGPRFHMRNNSSSNFLEVFLAIVELTTHVVKLLIKAINTLFLLITLWTRSELKNRYTIGKSGESCGSLACSQAVIIDVFPLTVTVVFRFWRKFFIQQTIFSGIRCFCKRSISTLTSPSLKSPFDVKNNK